MIELLAVIVVITLIATLLIPALANARRKAQRIQCVSSLKQIGLGFRIFATDHSNAFPAGVSVRFGGAAEHIKAGAVFRQFLAMSNELSTPFVLNCLADSRKPARDWRTLGESNVSYFVGLDAMETTPQMLLAGDRNLVVNGRRAMPGLRILTTNDAVGWDKDMHRGAGNVALGDGTVQQVTTSRLREQVRAMEASTNRLLIP